MIGSITNQASDCRIFQAVHVFHYFIMLDDTLLVMYISSFTFSLLAVAMVNVCPSHWFVTINKIVLMGQMKIVVSYFDIMTMHKKALELSVVSDQCSST